MTDGFRHRIFVRMFGGALASQALLSASNFLLGLILIRQTSNLEYGYYVLITTTTLLIAGLQGAFVQPPLVLRLTRLERAARADVVGGLYREQRRFLRGVGLTLLPAIAVLALTGVLQIGMALLALAALGSILATLYKESFRLVLLAYRQPYEILKADACYVLIVVCVVPLVTRTPAPAAASILVLAAGALMSGLLMSRFLWRQEPWNPHSTEAVLRTLAPVGGWSAAGSVTHWVFSQGYNYVVAAVLDVPAVAALAGTRLLMMPVNLMSSGMTSLMMPTASAWLLEHGPVMLFRRLWLIASGLAVLAIFYFLALWFARDALFTHLMHKSFAHRDALMLVWFGVFLVMIFRDQLQYLLGASGLYRPLTAVTAVAALISLTTGYVAVARLGVVGAPLGVLIGELANVSGILVLSVKRMKHDLPIKQAQ